MEIYLELLVVSKHQVCRYAGKKKFVKLRRNVVHRPLRYYGGFHFSLCFRVRSLKLAFQVSKYAGTADTALRKKLSNYDVMLFQECLHDFLLSDSDITIKKVIGFSVILSHVYLPKNSL